MNLRRCESPDNAARIAALSADQAPTAIIGCPHMTMPFEVMRMIRKRQCLMLESGTTGEVRFVNRLFRFAA